MLNRKNYLIFSILLFISHPKAIALVSVEDQKSLLQEVYNLTPGPHGSVIAQGIDGISWHNGSAWLPAEFNIQGYIITAEINGVTYLLNQNNIYQFENPGSIKPITSITGLKSLVWRDVATSQNYIIASTETDIVAFDTISKKVTVQNFSDNKRPIIHNSDTAWLHRRNHGLYKWSDDKWIDVGHYPEFKSGLLYFKKLNHSAGYIAAALDGSIWKWETGKQPILIHQLPDTLILDGATDKDSLHLLASKKSLHAYNEHKESIESIPIPENISRVIRVEHMRDTFWLAGTGGVEEISLDPGISRYSDQPTYTATSWHHTLFYGGKKGLLREHSGETIRLMPNVIFSLHATPYGIITSGRTGVDLFNPISGRVLQMHNNPRGSSKIWPSEIDSTICYAQDAIGLIEINLEMKTSTVLENEHYVTGIYEDPERNLYVSGWPSGLYKYTGQSKEKISDDPHVISSVAGQPITLNQNGISTLAGQLILKHGENQAPVSHEFYDARWSNQVNKQRWAFYRTAFGSALIRTYESNGEIKAEAIQLKGQQKLGIIYNLHLQEDYLFVASQSGLHRYYIGGGTKKGTQAINTYTSPTQIKTAITTPSKSLHR